MFSIQRINPDMAKYIKDTINKSMEKYKNNKNNILTTSDTNKTHNYLSLLPFVSLFSFLVSYKLGKLTK
jgi:hypothetical protein